MANYHPEFCVNDGTADVIIEKGKYWDDKVTFSPIKISSGYDPNHYISFDVNRGPEGVGWTMISTPGTFAVKSGTKTPENSNAVFMVAENGDIAITCENGSIRLKARDIHIESGHNVKKVNEGNVHIKGGQKVSIQSPTIEIESGKMLRLVSSGNYALQVSGLAEMSAAMSKSFCSSSKEGQIQKALPFKRKLTN